MVRRRDAAHRLKLRRNCNASLHQDQQAKDVPSDLSDLYSKGLNATAPLMSLVVEAHKSLINVGLRAASNAFISHLPIDIYGQDKVQNYVERAQTRLEHRMLYQRAPLSPG